MSDNIRAKIQELENEVRSSFLCKDCLSFTPLMPLALPHALKDVAKDAKDTPKACSPWRRKHCRIKSSIELFAFLDALVDAKIIPLFGCSLMCLSGAWSVS